MKVINIKFEFTDEEWAHYIEYFGSTEIRQTLYEGALGELDILLDMKEDIKERKGKTNE